jgi:uncharacterized small protein (TIGR04563 family)
VNDKRKQSIYMDVVLIKELREEAVRQGRTLSWLMQRAWKLARDTLKRLPAADREPWP